MAQWWTAHLLACKVSLSSIKSFTHPEREGTHARRNRRSEKSFALASIDEGEEEAEAQEEEAEASSVLVTSLEEGDNGEESELKRF